MEWRGLLERADEQASLRRLVDDAREGRGAAAILEGPAGIGKSALLEAAGAHARAQGVGTLSARASEFEGEIAFGLLRELLAGVLNQEEERRRLSVAIEGARRAMAILGEQEAAPAQPTVPERALLVLHQLVALAARPSGLLLLVDDAQWADAASLRFLAFHARRLAALPVGLAVAVRSPVDAGGRPALRELLVSESGRHLRPGPLSERASAELVRERWSRDAPGELCRACHEATGGNPLLLRELLAAVRQAGLPATTETIPRLLEIGAVAVAPLVLHRLARIPADSMELAQAAAVVGELHRPEEVASIAGLDPARAAEAAGVLVEADLLATAAPLRFVHPLTRSAIRASVPAARRTTWARAGARRLEDAGRIEAAAACLAELAPSADPRTAEILSRAGAFAQARGAPDVAASLLRRALAEPPAPDRVAEVRAALGDVQLSLGDPEAIDTLRTAFAAAADPRARAAVAANLARALIHAMRVGEAVDMLEATIAELADEHPELTDELEWMVVYHADWEATSRRPVAERPEPAGAGELAKRARLFALAKERIGACRPADEGIALLERALAGGALLAGAPVAQAGCALLLAMAGRPEVARTHLDEAVAAARRSGEPVRLRTALGLRGYVTLLEGDVTAAVRDTCAGADPEADSDLPGRYLVWMLIDCLLEQGLVEAAEAELRRYDLTGLVPDRAPLNGILHSRGRTRIAAGAVRTGLEDVLLCGARQEAVGQRNAAMLPWRLTAAEAHLTLGEPDRALALSGENLELARSFAAPHVLGPALRVHGLVLGGEEGLAALRDAVAVLRGCFARLELARARADLGAALGRVGERDAARDELTAAAALAQELGATALARRASDAAAASGARPRRAATRGEGALTPAEGRVVALAAQGASNQEIAEALFVTVKTVETHLSSSYRKLGIRSRTELPLVAAGPAAPS